MPNPQDVQPEDRSTGENVVLAAVYQVLGSMLMVTVAAFVKLAGTEATPMQAVLYRSVASALPLLGIMTRRRISPLSPRWKLLAVRGTVGFLALFCYFFAIAHIHLADVLALQQLAPIFVAFLSVALLKERPRRLHYLLAGICLVGAFLVVQPTRGIVALPSLVALFSACFSAVAYVSVRSLTRTEPTLRIVLWFCLTGAAFSFPLTLPGWRWPSFHANLFLVGAGLLAAPAQSLMTAAYRRAPAHVASAFSYATVPLAYLLGVVVWGERPNPLAHLGIAFVVAGGVAIVMTLRGSRSQSASRAS
jgi:drug/metabolite transporter (DMT)-like permease